MLKISHISDLHDLAFSLAGVLYSILSKTLPEWKNLCKYGKNKMAYDLRTRTAVVLNKKIDEFISQNDIYINEMNLNSLKFVVRSGEFWSVQPLNFDILVSRIEDIFNSE